MTGKDKRREVRISADDDDLLTEAAGLLGVSVSEFLLDRAIADAATIVDEHRTVRLAEDDHERFIKALDGPVRPPKELVTQARRARRLKRVDEVRVERLGEQHHLGAFTCGMKSLDDWLRDHALDNQRRDLSRTFVLLDDGDRVIGYYALTMGGVRREALPARYGRGLPRVRDRDGSSGPFRDSGRPPGTGTRPRSSDRGDRATLYTVRPNPARARRRRHRGAHSRDRRPRRYPVLGSPNRAAGHRAAGLVRPTARQSPCQTRLPGITMPHTGSDPEMRLNVWPLSLVIQKHSFGPWGRTLQSTVWWPPHRPSAS